ncbi:D-2-hydroxyacid dehydrogenase family protein, partial [Achromobacter xylosoxidans]|nr:D-2-hydroxyacid dehydrogenase family protein [Achromobacter xylosoxidans]
MKIAILDDYHDVAKRYADWGSLGGDAEVRIFNNFIPDEQVETTLAPFEVIVAMRERTPFPAERIRALPNLRLLVTTGMRNNAIDMQACAAQGIVVSGAPGSADANTATAELAWAHILGLFKHLPAEDAAMRRGMWQTGMPEPLAGKRLGVLGLGKLG